MRITIIGFYILSIILANNIAFWVGQWGLVITALLLIPFDFVIRAFFHEKWKGFRLWQNLTILIITGGVLSFLFNYEMLKIAIGSSLAFILAGFGASIFYQSSIKEKYWYKVNGSDLVAIIIDSFIFQWIAFSDISFLVMASQISMKFIGGLGWYFLLFEKLKIQSKW